MTRLIHLNGPPGIGKSTIASAFADQHPGVLNLDVDRVVAMIGGWREMFFDAFEAGRVLAAAMARTHLATGNDVIMPQLITNAREFADFDAAAAAAGAEYCHILLTADVGASIRRFMQRPHLEAGEHGAVIRQNVEANGGPDLLRKIYFQLTEFVAGKRLHSVISCESQTPEQTYRALEIALTGSVHDRQAGPAAHAD